MTSRSARVPFRRIEILHPQRTPADLVLVGGPDAAAGGADLGVAARASRAWSSATWYGRISVQARLMRRRLRTSHADRLEFGDFAEQRRR